MRINKPVSKTRNLRHHDDETLYALIAGEADVAAAAFGELYARHGSRLYAYCRTLCRNEDECNDVFQEAFTRFYEAARAGRPVRNVGAYLVRSARNICLNLRRDRKPTLPVEDDTLGSFDPPAERSELLQLIRTAMELLPDDYREAFFLREFADLPYQEIAEITGTTSVNARIRVTRAREKLRGILQPYIAELDEDRKKR